MIFFNYPIFGGDKNTVPLTPTEGGGYSDIENNSLTLIGGEYYYIHMAKHDPIKNDLSYAFGSSEPPADKLEWNNYTIMYVDFVTSKDVSGVLIYDHTVSAGNITHLDGQIQGYVLWKRIVGENKYIPLLYHSTNNLRDLNFNYRDFTAPLHTTIEYEIMLLLKDVPTGLVKQHHYVSKLITTQSNKIVLVDLNKEVWGTYITDGNCDVTRVYPMGIIQPLYQKYPTIIRNSLNNFEQVNVTGNWTLFINQCDEDGHGKAKPIFMSDDVLKYEGNWTSEADNKVNRNNTSTYAINSYRKGFVDFLTNNTLKLLKNIDGRMWLGYVNTDVTDNADLKYDIRNISFTFTEVGDWRDSEALYRAGFIDRSTSEWW